MANVRRAAEGDFDRMLEMGEAMHNESPRYRMHEFNRVKSLGIMRAMLDHPGYLMLVAESGGQLVGMLLGFVSENTFCSGHTVNEMVVYVAPESRGTSAAVKLVRGLESWANAIGVHDVVLGISTDVDAARTHDFYQRMGYEHAGTSLIKRVSITRH